MTPVKIKKLNKLLQGLFNAVTEDEILKMESGVLIVSGQVLPPAHVNELIGSAKAILVQLAWQQIVKDMKYVANKRMYEESKTIDDMVFGKAMLYTIDVMEKKFKNLSRLKPIIIKPKS